MGENSHLRFFCCLVRKLWLKHFPWLGNSLYIICPCEFSLASQRLRLSISRQILFCNFEKTCRNLVRVRALSCCQVLLRLQEELLCLPALLSHTHSHMKNAPMALSIWRAFLKRLAWHINGVHTRFNLILVSFRTGWEKKKKKKHVQHFLPVCFCGLTLCSACWLFWHNLFPYFKFWT